MCGICGIVETRGNGIALNELQAMNNIVIHRGPDDQGFALFTTGNHADTFNDLDVAKINKKYHVGFGHRRLSILDLSVRGHQPMFDGTGRFCIVYNGEIYNYKELRNELESKGMRFNSNTDTEVVLTSYIEWGVEALRKFNGMWAFAIYDRKQGQLFCSRDHFGIKPFYYLYGEGFFIFSSEIKQIHTYVQHMLSVNENVLSSFMFWGFETYSQETFFKNIFLLSPAHYILLNKKDIVRGAVCPKKYWNYEHYMDLTEENTILKFKEIFTDAVAIRLRSDVPVGITLSGGLDSSSVACTMAEIHIVSNVQSTPRVFTSEYHDQGMSEKYFADIVRKKIGFEHVYSYPDHNHLTGDWNKLLWHMEEPFGGLSYFSSWKIYEKCREADTPVILTGQGGDELLLGYEWYRNAYLNILLRSLNFNKAVSEFVKARRNANMSFVKQLLYQMYFTFPIVRKIRSLIYVKPYLSRELFHQYWERSYELLQDNMCHRSLAELQLKEVFKYQLQHLIRHEDRVSMAFSIESRLPFLDYRLFELILGVKDSLKIESGWSKYILRMALTNCLPDEIRNRKDKKGFETPSKRLIMDNKEFFIDLIKRHEKDEYINTENVLDGLTNGNINGSLLCRILTFFGWRETFAI